MRVWYGIFLAGMCLWLAACGANTPSPSVATATPVVPTLLTTVQTDERSTPSPAATRAVTPDSSQPIALTLWVPEEFATGAELGGAVLEAQIAEFEATHPGIRLNYVLKAPYGKGGMVDWLGQVQELMPERLPDAAIVDTRELDQLQKLGLLHPLQRDLPAGAYWDLFPPAQDMARQTGQWNNQPLVLETEHLIYDARRIATPPLSWQGVLSETTRFAFAADSTEAFLFNYMQNGGSLDPFKQPAHDTGVMQSILDFYRAVRGNGNLDASAAAMESAQEVMPLFVSGQAPVALVRARDYLVEREALPDARAAAIPTRDGNEAALVSGWSYVILTDDPARHRAASEYLAWLIEPARLAEWTRAARVLPASSSAFAQASDDSEYADLIWRLMNNALVAPSFAQQAPYAEAWHTAVPAVLNGQLAPDDAAFRAAQAITK